MSDNQSPLPEPDQPMIGIFLSRGPQSGVPTGFALSPDGHFIFSSTPNDLLLLDARTGRPTNWILTGPNSKITSIDWFNSKKCFLGSDRGDIYVAAVGEQPTLTSNPMITISYSFQDIQQPIRALRWDTISKLLALCYEDGVSIWKNTNGKWKNIDRISIKRERLQDGVTTVVFYGVSRRRLYIGGGFGYAVWHGREAISYYKGSTSGITTATISPDGKHLVAATFCGAVKVWTVDDGIIGSELSHRAIKSGQEYRSINPFTPVQVSSTGLVAVGTQVGQVELGRLDGTTVDMFNFEQNWSVMGLLIHEDRLYTQYMGPVGAIILVGWVDNMEAFNTFQTLHEQIIGIPKELAGTHIDLDNIPRGTLAGPALQTGRVSFAPPTISVPMQGGRVGDNRVLAESNVSSKPAQLKLHGCSDVHNSSRSACRSACRFFVLLVTLGCTVAFAWVITSNRFLRWVLVLVARVMRAADVFPNLVLEIEGYVFD
ncbi:hypothetical protein FRC12_003287 [Ceratobasidium sp. 428]|nr:hypothetical protein FRC12_003287 [Ceratobasidium sp. 428]